MPGNHAAEPEATKKGRQNSKSKKSKCSAGIFPRVPWIAGWVRVPVAEGDAVKPWGSLEIEGRIEHLWGECGVGVKKKEASSHSNGKRKLTLKKAGKLPGKEWARDGRCREKTQKKKKKLRKNHL